MNSIDIWNDLGNLYLKANAINAAIDAYNRALEQGYRTAAIYSNLASAYVIQRNFSDSIPMYQKSIELLTSEKEKALVYTQIGDSYRQLFDFDNAIAAFRTAIEIEPGNPSLCVGLGAVQSDLEKLYGLDKKDQNEQSDINSSVLLDFDSVSALEPQGDLQWEASDDMQAQEESQIVETSERLVDLTFGDAVDASTAFPSLWVNAACGIDSDNHGVDQPELVEHSAQPGIFQTETTEISADEYLSSDQGGQEREKGSGDSIESEKLEKENGVRVTLLLTLGIMHWRKGNLEEADSTLQAAINVAVQIHNQWFEALAWNALALVKTALGDIIAAIQAYLRAVDLAPDQIFPWNNLGSLYGRIGSNDKAMEAFQIAIRQSPQDSTSWDGLGDIYTKLGRLEDAIAAYQLGNVFDQKVKNEDAIKAYEKAFDFYNFTITALEDEKTIPLDTVNLVESLNVDEVSNSEVEAAECDPVQFADCEDQVEMLDEISADQISEADFELEEIPSGENEEAESLEPFAGYVVSEESILSSVLEEELPRIDFGGSTEVGVVEAELNNMELEAALQVNEAGGDNLSTTAQAETEDIISKDSLSQDVQPEVGLPVIEQVSDCAQDMEMPGEPVSEVLSGDVQNIQVEQAVVEPVIISQPEPTLKSENILPAVVTIGPAPQADPARVALTIASYEATVRENPRNDRAWDSLGNLYRITQRNADAIYAFERAVSLEPTRYIYHYQLGTLYAAQGNYRDAIIEIERVVELNSEFIFAHCALASYLRKMGKNDEAQRHIALALPYMAKEKEYDRACFESIRGNIDEAIQLLEGALEKRQTTIEFIRRDLDLDFIRQDARYKLFEEKYAQSVVEY